jgi:hypothetical protein
MSREVIGYVVREGKARGQGRYLNRWSDPLWLDKGAAIRPWEEEIANFDGPDARFQSDVYAQKYGGRVVAIVRKTKASAVDDVLAAAETAWHRKILIAQADQKRAEESQAAAWEQVRGLEMKVAILEARIAEAKQALG